MKFDITFSNDCDTLCTFQHNNWTSFGRLNECLVQGVQSESRNDCVVRIKTCGNPDDDFECYPSGPEDFDEDEDIYSYEIKSFYIYMSPRCLVIPSNIGNFFKNLTILVVAEAGLRTVSKEELKPFKQLKGLYLDKNHLEIIEGDLLIHNPKIQELNFSRNRLRFIAHNVLDSLKNLKQADFYRNPCINMGSKTPQQIEGVKQFLKAQFEPSLLNCNVEEEAMEHPKPVCE